MYTKTIKVLFRVILLSSSIALIAPKIFASSASLEALKSPPVWRSDSGKDTYTNPPLYADFPDPDIIRVGEDFYFATTTFANSPGLTILHSKDLVNWEYTTHVISRLDGLEQHDFINGNSYRHGIYAPSLRYHNGTFYVAVSPEKQKTRIYYSQDIKGPWKYHELNTVAFDPGLFFDEDGKAYLATSGSWDGTVTLHTLSENCSEVVASKVIYFYKGAEGSKIIKRGEWYYLFNSIPSRLALTVSRAKKLFGPWETKAQIDDTTGGHQGALVDLPDGSFYGFVMRDSGSIGRMTNISPIFWEDDWPVWGTKESPGKVPETAIKPIKNKSNFVIATSDDFSANQLGLQWQWNHNPDNARWSLSERPGFLRLKATTANSLWSAKNTLTQKGQGPWSRGEVKLDISNVTAGDICGFGTLGKFSGQVAVHADSKGKHFLSMSVMEDKKETQIVDERVASIPIRGKTIFLRADLNFKENAATIDYSLDRKKWTNLGGKFVLAYDWRTGTFQGEQFAIFCYSPSESKGYIDIDYFTLSGQ